MEDLSKLMKDVTEKVQEVNELREDRDSKQKELVKTMQDNYNRLFKDDVMALTKFINSVRHDGNIQWYYDGGYYCWLDKNGEAIGIVANSLDDTPIEKGQFFVNTYMSGNTWFSRFGVRGYDQNLVHEGLPDWKYSKHFESYLEGFLPYLKTEEDTLKCTKLYKKVFAKILGEILENCDLRIETIKESIEKLKNELSSSSTVIEKEDGTIELTLNGKTYVGTVKENK